MPLSATLTSRRVRATTIVGERFIRGLVPVTIAGASVVSVALSAVTTFVCAIAGVSVVTCSVGYSTALAPVIAAESTVAAGLSGSTLLVPAVIAGESAASARLLREGYVRVTSGSDIRVTSSGDRRIIVQLA